MADVFVSYKSERRSAVEHFVRCLESYGYSVWWDYGLFSGVDFARQIEREVRAAKACVVLWCTRSVDSHWVLNEAQLALNLKKIIPAKIEDVDIPLGYLNLDTIDLSNWDASPRGHGLDRLLGQVALMTKKEPQPQFAVQKELDDVWRRYGARRLLEFGLAASAIDTDLENFNLALNAAPSVYARKPTIQSVSTLPKGWKRSEVTSPMRSRKPVEVWVRTRKGDHPYGPEQLEEPEQEEPKRRIPDENTIRFGQPLPKR